jgi:hypothetical protein
MPLSYVLLAGFGCSFCSRPSRDGALAGSTARNWAQALTLPVKANHDAACSLVETLTRSEGR